MGHSISRRQLLLSAPLAAALAACGDRRSTGGADDAKLKVLMDNLLHHIEEEQTELFPIFEKLPKDERDEVAERLADRKRELESEE